MKKIICITFIIIVLGSCSGKNDFYKPINESYYLIFDSKKNENYGNNNWYKEYNNFSDEMLEYFTTDESMKLDNLQRMPFLNYTISNDGLIRLFSWGTNINDSGGPFETLIQYRKYDKLYSLLLKEKIVSTVFYDHPAAEQKYYEIVNLNKDTYLLLGQRKFDDKIEYSFITIYLKVNDMIIPYYAFENIYSDSGKDMSMVLFDGYLKRINAIETNFEDTKFKIKIFYDLIEEIDFTFDGFIFKGNYKKLKEILGGP